MGSDVSIVSGGLAGLPAAPFLADRGTRILVVNEMHEPTGRLLWQLHHVGGRADALHDGGWRSGQVIAGTVRTD